MFQYLNLFNSKLRRANSNRGVQQMPNRRAVTGLTGYESLERRVVLNAVPFEPQFLVSETTLLEESAPAVAVVESSGQMVATWSSFEEATGDTSGLGVYVQQYMNDGSPIGDPVLVNVDQTAGDQFSSEVAVDATGRYVVVWQGQDLDGFGVYGQRYAADGTQLGSAFQLNTVEAGDQSQPAIAMDNAGNFIVAWQSDGQDGSGVGVYARRYDFNGDPTGTEEFLVNTSTEGDQRAPAAAAARGIGHFVISWEGEVIAEHSSFEIFAHLYDAAGDTIKSEFQVNDTAAREQVKPDVAMDASGNMVFTWTTEGIPGSGSDVFAQRVDALGDLAGGEFQVNSTTLQGQLNSVVAIDGDGDFFINWQSSHQDDFSWGIFGRAYSAVGLPLTTELQVNTYAEQPQTQPALGVNTQGQAVSVWLGLDVDHANAVHAQRYQLPGTDFTSVGDEIILANYQGLEASPAAAAVSESRNFFVAWQSYGEDGSGLGVLGRRLNSMGDALGDAFVINTTVEGNQINPSVAMDAAGNAVVVWESADLDGHGIFAQRFDASGNPVGGEFQINSTELGNQTQPSVAMNWLTGEFAVAWQGPDLDGEGIYGQRFGADGVQLGSEFQVNAETDLAQVSPEITMNAAGQFAVTWVSDHRAAFDPEDSEKSIFVQWYDSDGTWTGDEQLVHSIDPAYEAQEYPDIAMDADGNMIVVWQSITQDGSAWGVFGRQLLADKTPVQPAEFQINQNTGENQRRATVASDAAGNFAVSWQSDLQDESATAILSRQYHADATPETDEMLVNTWTLGPQILPVTTMTMAGDFGVFWQGQGTARTEGVHGRIFEEGYVAPPPHITVTPAADQFLVGEAAGLEPSFPAVAVIEDSGNYVAAWTSFEQPEGDESGLGVYAQMFTADGTPLIDPILVNASYTADDQSHPAVAVDELGNFVVTWQSLQQDGAGWGIYAQRFAADGTLVGSEFQVNSVVDGDQESPTIAMDNPGNFLISWQSPDSDGVGIFARRYDATGTPLEAAEFQVNVTSEGNQTAPTAARARDDSRYVIGWQSEVIGGEGEIDVNILANLYAANGDVLSEEFAVNTITEKDQVGPHVAMATNGDFVFAWTSEGQEVSGADVYARRFSAAGIGQGDDFLVNSTTARGQQYPSVGIDADGDFIVTWQSSHQDAFSWGIFGSAYDSAGNLLTDEFQVNTNVQGPQVNPAINANSDGTAVVTWLGLDSTHKPAVHAQRYQLPTGESDFEVGFEGETVLSNYVSLEDASASAAVDANGNYVVTWQSYGEDGSGLGVYARQFDADGIPLGDKFQVNTTTFGNQSHPAVASDDAGNFTVVWQAIDQDGEGYGIFAQRYDSIGNAIGGEFQVNTGTLGHQTNPDVAISDDGSSMVIVWQGPDLDGDGIYGQRYDSEGIPVGDEFQINQFTDLGQVSPTVSMNASGEFVVAWVSDHRAVFDPTDSEKSIFVQWFDADGNVDGEEVLVHSLNPQFEAQELPDIAIDEDGNFVIVWQSINQDGNTWGVFGRQMLKDKTPVQPIEFQVNQTVMAPQRHATVSLDAEGNFVVAWQGHAQDASGPGVFARAYDACAVPQTDEFLVPSADAGPQTWPVVAMAPTGKLGIFWTGHGTERVEGAHGRIFDVEVDPIPKWVINGTSGDDVFYVDMTGDHFVVTVNGVIRTLNPCQASSLVIHGLEGEDQIRVIGGELNETALLNVGGLAVYNDILSIVADSFETTIVTAGGGEDQAFFEDSAGNDTFLSQPTFSSMRGDGYFNRANGFGLVVANATAGDAGGVGDLAFLQDSAGNDIFLSRPEFGALSGDGFYYRANGFDLVVAQAIAGDAGGMGDQAFLQDSAGNDTFVAHPEFAVLSGNGFRNRANGFDLVAAQAILGDAGGMGDQAFLHDSAGNDNFLAHPEFGVLSGTGFRNRANGFDLVVAQAIAGNAGGLGDQAFLQDSSGNDVFYSRPEFSTLYGDGFRNRANGFDQVAASAVAGNAGGLKDRAQMFDSIFDDLYYGRGESGSLSGNGFRNWASGFDDFFADATAGGVDTLNVENLEYSLTHEGWENII